MRAHIGDTLRVHGRVVGNAGRDGEIIDIRGGDGEPPYLVRFADGHESLMVPGADSEVEHHQ